MSKYVCPKFLVQCRRDYDLAINEKNPRAKKEILDRFTLATGYHRKYANSLLTRAIKRKGGRPRNKRQRSYGPEVKEALIVIWRACAFICSRRLVPFLPAAIPKLIQQGHLKISEETHGKLLSLSAATADRLLKDERRTIAKTKGPARGSNRIRKKLPIHTIWDLDVAPGSFEIDLVEHNGGITRGNHLYTCALTDIHSGWTDFLAIPTKQAENVLQAISALQQGLPIQITCLDSDNGGEFMNAELDKFCNQNSIHLSHGRSRQSNDQAHIEEKNGSVVRRFVGYGRLEGESDLRTLNQLFKVLRLYLNYFQPSQKLREKIVTDSKVKKLYDPAKTPHQRLLEADVPATQKDRLRKIFDGLDPVKLLSEITRLQSILEKLKAEANGHHIDKRRMSQSRTRARAKAELTNNIACILRADPHISTTNLVNALNKQTEGAIGHKQRITIARIKKDWHRANLEF